MFEKTKINEKEAGVGPFLKKECGSGDGGQLTRNQLRRVRFEYRRGQFFVIVLLTKKLCEKKQLIDGSYLISIKYTYCSVKISAYLSLVFGQHTEDLYNYFSQSGLSILIPNILLSVLKYHLSTSAFLTFVNLQLIFLFYC